MKQYTVTLTEQEMEAMRDMCREASRNAVGQRFFARRTQAARDLNTKLYLAKPDVAQQRV